jgi:hypothetical protein
MACGRVDAKMQILFTSALVGGEWSASRTSRFTHEERAPALHWIRGFVGLRAGLNDMQNWKSFTIRDSNSYLLVVQPVAK